MSNFLENVIIGLAISLVGAIFFIAYKHPKVYAKYFNLLYALNFIFFTCFMVHFHTKRKCFESFSYKYPNNKVYNSVIKDLNEYSDITPASFFIIMGTLIFLSFLRNIIDKAEKQEPK